MHWQSTALTRIAICTDTRGDYVKRGMVHPFPSVTKCMYVLADKFGNYFL